MAENENLIKSIQELKKGGKPIDFANELTKAVLYVPVSITPEPVEGVVQPNSVVSYITINEKEQDKNLIMAFTSRDEYVKYFKPGSTQIIKHTYNELRSVIMNHEFDGFLIDVMGENIAVTRETMIQIARAMAPMQVQQEKLSINGPDALVPAENVSEGFKRALEGFLKTAENISRCWIMQATRENDDTPTKVCVVEFTGSMEETFRGIASAVNITLDQGRSIGLISYEDKVAAKAVENIAPFYTK
ncbi:MAG: enhanced serine sensitivity protein SseB C-terminal domain-containing protein [Firmicutes bacterium]|nr:enhanced serine sensitivity protein SseB C-terminal domain-containing protein [Bacillota bacterium]